MSRLPDPANLRGRIGRKHLRYAMVSLIAVPVTQVVLVAAYVLLDWPGWAANLLAVSVGCIPSYTLNRYWVWNKRSRNEFWREVAPFWAMAIIGLLFSTLLVHVADQWWQSTLVVSAANLTAFGVLWVAKFLVLDRYLFGMKLAAEPEAVTAA